MAWQCPRSRRVSGDIGAEFAAILVICGVGVTLQMCNRVTNHGDMGTFYRPVPPHDKNKKQKHQPISNHSGHSCYSATFIYNLSASLELELLVVDCSFMLSIEVTDQTVPTH